MPQNNLKHPGTDRKCKSTMRKSRDFVRGAVPGSSPADKFSRFPHNFDFLRTRCACDIRLSRFSPGVKYSLGTLRSGWAFPVIYGDLEPERQDDVQVRSASTARRWRPSTTDGEESKKPQKCTRDS